MSLRERSAEKVEKARKYKIFNATCIDNTLKVSSRLFVKSKTILPAIVLTIVPTIDHDRSNLYSQDANEINDRIAMRLSSRLETS